MPALSEQHEKLRRSIRHDLAADGERITVLAISEDAAVAGWILLQTNVLNQHIWATRQELHLATVVWIERKYHRKRSQDTLGGNSPSETR